MYQDDHQDHEEENAMQSTSKSKVDYWGGYYDFLINEGSYKFWAVFQVSFNFEEVRLSVLEIII